MEVLDWLDYAVILSSNHALPVRRYFDTMVTAGKSRCSILVQVVSIDLYVSNMDISLAVFLPNGGVNDCVGVLSR